jgi:hypothetical protein
MTDENTNPFNTPVAHLPASVEHCRLGQSPSIAKLALALSKAQGQISNAAKDEQGVYGSYATLAATWDACRKPLCDNELAVIQVVETEGARTFLRSTLVHSSGEFYESVLELKFESSGRMNPMQAMGSAITYARRYSLQALVGIAPADDDDGAGAGTPPPKQQRPPAAKTTPPKEAAQSQASKSKPAAKPKDAPPATGDLLAAVKAAGWTPVQAKHFMQCAFNKDASGALDKEEIASMTDVVKTKSFEQACAMLGEDAWESAVSAGLIKEEPAAEDESRAPTEF